MSSEEQLVNCVRHTRGFIRTIILLNLLMKLFKEINFKGYFKKAVISCYS